MGDPASVLAPPPGWTPNQPSGDLPSTISAPLPTQITPPVSVSTAAPGQVDTINAPQSTQMLQPQQASTDPEVIAGHAHQSWLGHIMDVVGSILGGDQTIHITKSPDGTMRVTHDPSTTGEKWSRVAQAALMGGAAGLAHGQGPGGAANAIAAGVQTGAALPQQQLTQANQEATAANQQLVAKANMARLNQMVTMGTMEMRQKGIQMTDDEVNRANNNASYLLANPANRRLGEITDMSQLPSFAAKNADLISQHANGQIHTQTEIGDDGKPHVGVYLVDQNWMDQKNDKPYTYSRLAPGKTLNDPMTLENVTIPAGAHTNSELMATHEAEDAKITAYKLKQDEINQKGDKIPTTGPGATVAGYLETDPARRAALLSAGKTIAQQEINKAVAGRAAAAGTPEQYQALAADLNAGNVDISQIRTRKDWPQMYAAARQYAIDNGLPAFDPATASAKYKARVQTIGKYTGDGDASQKIQGFSTLLEHLGDMSDNADELRRTNSPYLNRPINELDRAIAGGTQVGPAELRTQAPAHEFANVLSNNRALNNDEKEQAAKNLNVNMTPAQLQANGKQMAKTAVERLAPVFQAYREATNGQESPTQLTPRAMQTLRNMGLGDYAMQEMHGQGPTTPTGPTSSQHVIPPGAQVGRKGGQIVGYSLNGKWTQF